MNWSILIETVPDAEDLHIISEDGDYFSSLNENVAHPFLAAEWNERKGSSLRVYRTLSNFMREHFDGVAFSFDKEKEGLIDRLGVCGSFASTHEVISKLNTYGYFALTEVEKILDAANNNSQFGSIVTDYDISDLLNRIAVPRKLELTNSDFISIVDKVIKEQLERDTD